MCDPSFSTTFGSQFPSGLNGEQTLYVALKFGSLLEQAWPTGIKCINASCLNVQAFSAKHVFYGRNLTVP